MGSSILNSCWPGHEVMMQVKAPAAGREEQGPKWSSLQKFEASLGHMWDQRCSKIQQMDVLVATEFVLKLGRTTVSTIIIHYLVFLCLKLFCFCRHQNCCELLAQIQGFFGHNMTQPPLGLSQNRAGDRKEPSLQDGADMCPDAG